MNKVYIAIIGKTGAGKETVFNLIKEEARQFRVSIHHFSDPLNEILDIILKPKCRPNQQKLSTLLRRDFGEDLLGNILAHRAKLDPADIVVLDGIRRPQDVEMLRRLPRNYLVLVEAPPDIRFERIKLRADRPGDAEKTYEEFLHEQSAESESLIDEIGKEADVYLDNSGTLENLRLQVVNFLQKKLNLI